MILNPFVNMKLFGTDGVRGVANKFPVTAEIALKLGKAAALVLTKGKQKPIFIIGKDTRRSNYMLENALTAGLTSMGAEVYLVGPMPTPAVAHLVRSFNADAGIMISASHNPAEHNGIKFFDGKGIKLPDKIEEEIENLVLHNDLEKENINAKHIGRAYRIDDAQGRYIEFAKNTVKNISLKGLKIVLDCSNGAAYKVAPLVLSELGAELIVLGNKPDGFNINKECGSLYPEIAKAAVLGHQADLGISLDGDADRIVMIDNKGNILDGDHILAIAGLYLIKNNKLKNNTIVATQYSNMALDKLLESKNGKVKRVKNGDRYVIEEMNKNDFTLGGEASGHIIFKDYNSTGDGLIAGLQILKILIEEKKKLSEMSNILQKYPQVLININVSEKKKIELMKNVVITIDESTKLLGDEGRLLIRYSGTEKKCRVMVEGKDHDLIKKIANNITNEIKKEVGV
jgi:phosphoglucosamine mutase